jgi:phage terminase small subunit
MENIILTPKQQRFCDEYLVDLNATKAALRAGYSGATALNGKLMTIPKIRYYLQQRTEAATRKAQVNHEMILNELCKMAFGNMGNYFTSEMVR